MTSAIREGWFAIGIGLDAQENRAESDSSSYISAVAIALLRGWVCAGSLCGRARRCAMCPSFMCSPRAAGVFDRMAAKVDEMLEKK